MKPEAQVKARDGSRWFAPRDVRARVLTLLSLAIVAAAVGMLPLPAHAQSAGGLADPTNPAALRHLEKGRRYYDTEQWDLAIVEFKAAALIEPVPKLFFNLGQANRFAGHYEEARRHFLRFLDKTAQMKGADIEAIRATAEQLAADMEAAASREPTGIPSPDSDARPEPSGVEEQGASVPADLSTGAGPSAERPTVAPWHHDRLGWALAGGGVVGALAGGGLLMRGSSLYDQAEIEDRQSVAADLRARAGRSVTVGTIVGAAGAAIGIAGVIRLAMTDDAPTPQAPIQVTVGWATFSISGRF
jgi:tetratricopeptide (TPR) repeat protein